MIREGTKEKVQAVMTLVSDGMTIKEACKQVQVSSMTVAKYRAQFEPKKTRKKREIPQLLNVHVQSPESGLETVSVVVLKGRADVMKEIVAGLGGVLRG